MDFSIYVVSIFQILAQHPVFSCKCCLPRLRNKQYPWGCRWPWMTMVGTEPWNLKADCTSKRTIICDGLSLLPAEVLYYYLQDWLPTRRSSMHCKHDVQYNRSIGIIMCMHGLPILILRLTSCCLASSSFHCFAFFTSPTYLFIKVKNKTLTAQFS